ncbi:hypothetical protein E2562_024584 [Oryza meyeriana var. granulata]|uniref:Uncharacterized protein n=1 Tax=Oryza meyeriana var. granulata TaxID=110450 RepID=A0A6G1CRK4_9ORYZ|nr:hypothetical protein E2562_024584 [Oryza meyeriana var. granulata]
MGAGEAAAERWSEGRRCWLLYAEERSWKLLSSSARSRRAQRPNRSCGGQAATNSGGPATLRPAGAQGRLAAARGRISLHWPCPEQGRGGSASVVVAMARRRAAMALRRGNPWCGAPGRV